MKIIGLHGKKRRGKDTAAQIAAKQLGGTYKLISPADNLKMLLCETLGIEYNFVGEALKIMEDCKDTWTLNVTRLGQYDPETLGNGTRLSPGWSTIEPVKVLSGRELQENIGHGARKVFGTDFWIDQVLPPVTHHKGDDEDRLAAMYPGVDVLFIPSIRYPNEAHRVRAHGGVIWEVVRPGYPDDGSKAPTEQRLAEELIDYTISNSLGLQYLADRVSEAIRDTL